mmetsp:Transcript_31820/g.28874  ORF Transcript_31820/g.28874 Transcript_31820/m.28874 type:complete len:231 (+) Transcript_31820:9-701(+)
MLSGEIVDIITDNEGLKAYITSLDSKIYVWDYSEKLKIEEDTNVKKIELAEVPVCLFMEEKFEEGLIGCLEGGIVYANFKEELFSKLVGAPSTENPVIRVKNLHENIICTIHGMGNFKLWNLENGEELANFTYERIYCKDVLYNPNNKQILAYFDDNSFKTYEYHDYSKTFNFMIDEQTLSTERSDQYIAGTQFVDEDNYFYYFAVDNWGELYTSELKDKEEHVWVEAIE